MVDVARAEALEAELERAYARIAVLEEAMGVDLFTPIEWKLSPSEMRIFGALMARPVVTANAAMAVLYRDQGKEEAQIKILDVFICKIRKKLLPIGITIETVWGQGYRLSAPCRAKAKELIDAAAWTEFAA